MEPANRPEIRMSLLKSKLPMPWLKYRPLLKYGAIGLCSLLWTYALVGQFYTSRC